MTTFVSLNLYVKSGNEAFQTLPRWELVEILRNAASQIRDGDSAKTIYDSNGNKVGDWSLEIVEEEE